MWVSVSVLIAMPSESITSVYFSPVFIICSWRLGRTSCVFMLSAGGVSSLHAHLKPIGIPNTLHSWQWPCYVY